MNKLDYRLMVDNPKELIGVYINMNDKPFGKITKIIKKDPPYTIYQFEIREEKDKK